MKKLTKFLHGICPKINKIPEFYTTFVRKMLEFYIMFARKIFFGIIFLGGGGGGGSTTILPPLPLPNLERLWLGPRPPTS